MKTENHELVAAYFIWKREIIRFLRSKSRIAGSLGMPLFFLAIFGMGLEGALRSSSLGGSYLDFITPGILAMVLMTASVFSGAIVIMDRQFGFLKETLVAPVRRSSIVIGKSLGGATTAVFQGLLILFFAAILGAGVHPSSWLMLLLLMFLISASFVSFGIAVASVMEDMHGFQLVMNFFIMPLFFLSGALFPLSSAPEPIRIASYLDPLTYAVEALRHLAIGKSSMGFGLCLAVIAAFFLLSTSAAIHLFERIES
ncbi:MAG: ABC transporter permease [Candidatus Micrarchaeota archaeon]|nr:ABC transporter permease [Candidatus Micrarchaeota archaeon]